jgi:hypothetical protein
MNKIMSVTNQLTEKNKGGRPEIILTDKQINQVEALAAYLTIEDIAHYLGVGENTFYRIRERQPEVFEAYRMGVSKARSRVASKLMRFIDSEDLTATTLDATKFYLTHQAGWAKTQEMNVTTRDVTPKEPKQIIIQVNAKPE